VTDSDFSAAEDEAEIYLSANVMIEDNRSAMMVYTSGTTGKVRFHTLTELLSVGSYS
jgi:acyl-coenzyme A synthetase/AMP-(fatty) acid ligase